MRCGLLGRHLAHSYSPEIHSHLADYSYEFFEKEPEEVEDFLKNGDFHGLNVTIPYKKAVIPFLDELSPVARRVGAVNTIVRRPDGTLIGHNTDYFGFSSMVRQSGLNLSGKKVLVLGSGGASATVQAVLGELGANGVVISRSGENHYGNLSRHADAAAIVNTTPVGMYPNNGEAPLSLEGFPKLEGVLDIIFNPARTALLQQAEQRHIPCMNGLWMLVAQAWESAQWFSGNPISPDKIPEIHGILRRKMENIVLIGMPGCGKTTVGQRLAERLGRQFVDADTYLEETYRRPITEIIPKDGEAAFRAMETAVLEELGKKSSLVIATGGGCVTREENYPLLHGNGRIFWLTRPVELLPTAGRPLSHRDTLAQMYRAREPLYRRFADCTVDNTAPAEQTVETILRHWEETV